MVKLKIYLGDLTYNTIVVSTEALPINIGYIASYCKKRFGSEVEFTLFKYHQELEKAILESPPDILGLSNYVWCQNLSHEMFKIFSEKNPNGLRVWGGPNFPLDVPSQAKFFEDFPYFDVYVPIDGEIGFSNIVEKALQSNSSEIRSTILKDSTDSCVVRNLDKKLLFTFHDGRIKNLDEIPSPYLTGLLDKFFDDNLIPMLQTNRGCPFSCSFCTDGRDAVNQVNRFSQDRVKQEIEYITKNVKKNVHSLFISDLNFGMIPGDLDTCNVLAKMQEQYNYPQKILSTTGKNNKERIIDSIKSLNGSLALSMSVQSLDEDVLKNIQRDNISVDRMLGLAPTIKESGLRTTAEIIVGLPGETYDSHLDTIRQLVGAKLDDVIIYTCFLLTGSEMATPEQQSKWKFQTKHRILPMDFAKLSNGKNICEIDNVIIGSKDLSFDEYVALRMIAFTLWMTNKGVLYNTLIKFLRELKIDVAELFFQMVERRNDAAPDIIKKVFESFKQATIDELYDSPEEILSKIQDEEFYQKLVDEKAAINVIRYHHALVLSKCMDEWTSYVLAIAHKLIQETGNLNEKIDHMFSNISNYCKGSSHNPLGKDRMLTNPEYSFNYDIPKWLSDPCDNLLETCKTNKPITGKFVLTDDQFNLINDNLYLFGNSTVAYTKALKMVPEHMFWRKPIFSISKVVADIAYKSAEPFNKGSGLC